MARHDDGGPSNLDARFEAQKIAFGPMAFQAARALRATGIFEALRAAGAGGLTPAEAAERVALPRYGATVLMEAGLVIGALRLDGERYALTRVGRYLLADELTRVNMDFVHDVCYRGMFHLEEAVRTETPAGLKELADAETIYHALASLPERVRRSWFAFDHYYSDSVFPLLVPVAFARRPRRILDVGGNTGKWAIRCCAHDPAVEVTVLDLPGQLAEAAQNVTARGFADRVRLVPADFRDPSKAFPTGHDLVWMSQFLDCFSEDEIVSILARARDAMDDDARLYILETYWDRQAYPAAAYCVVMTSLYFTALANGNSRMYHSRDMKRCVAAAGLTLEEDRDGVGLSHTLFVCRR